MDKNYRFKFFLIFTLIWSVVILVLTTIPSSALPGFHFRHIDKIVHFCLFGVLGFFLSGVLRFKWKASIILNWAIFTVLVATLYGSFIEVIQDFIPGRRTDLVDILFNFLGAAVGVILFRLFKIVIT